jgi:hypothetical protein
MAFLGLKPFEAHVTRGQGAIRVAPQIDDPGFIVDGKSGSAATTANPAKRKRLASHREFPSP